MGKIYNENDLVSRQAAIEAFGLSEKTRKYGGDHSGYDTRMLYEIQDVLENLPSAQPERKTGKWVEKLNVYGVAYCSLCGYELHTNDTNFCPNCGADMRGEQNG